MGDPLNYYGTYVSKGNNDLTLYENNEATYKGNNYKYIYVNKDWLEHNSSHKAEKGIVLYKEDSTSIIFFEDFLNGTLKCGDTLYIKN